MGIPIGPILGAVGGALGGLFPQKSTQTTQTQQQGGQASSGSSNVFNQTDVQNYINNLIRSGQTGTQTGATTGTTAPNLSPQAQALISNLTQKYMTLAPPSMTGYGAQQTSNINQAADTQEQAINALMASRGLSTSPVAATAQAGIEQNRLNQVTSMLQQLPILQQQMNLQNLAAAGGFAASIPYGQTTAGTSQAASDTSGYQNQTGGSETLGTNNTQSNFANTLMNWLNSLSTTKGSAGGGIGGLISGLIAGGLLGGGLNLGNIGGGGSNTTTLGSGGGTGMG